MTTEDLLDVVDEHDNPLREAPRWLVHCDRLLHRAVHIFVFDPQDRLLIQVRSETKDEDPLLYTSSASGHVDAGESYDQAARRELQEELGVERPLEFLTKLPASPRTGFEHTALYRACASLEELTVNRDEIAALFAVSVDELRERLRVEPQKFSSSFRELIRWYFGL